MRIELYNRNIDVTVVCPGPVETELFNKSFTTKLDVPMAKLRVPSTKIMTAQRCAQLYTLAIVNKVDEAWLISNPFLFAIYFAVNFPTITKFIGKRLLTQKRLASVIKGTV